MLRLVFHNCFYRSVLLLLLKMNSCPYLHFIKNIAQGELIISIILFLHAAFCCNVVIAFSQAENTEVNVVLEWGKKAQKTKPKTNKAQQPHQNKKTSSEALGSVSSFVCGSQPVKIILFSTCI